jgi:hypothetical protein
MRIPSLPILMAAFALVWCVAGVFVHTTLILVYPAAWLTILIFFLGLNKVYDAMHGKNRAGGSH